MSTDKIEIIIKQYLSCALDYTETSEEVPVLLFPRTELAVCNIYTALSFRLNYTK